MSLLGKLANPVRVLQIIHVTDLHVVAQKQPAAKWVRRLERWAQSLGWQSLFEMLHDGTAPHDRFAPLFLQSFLQRITVNDPDWSSLPRWLVDTGDQTTFGDNASLVDADRVLRDLANVCGAGSSVGAVRNMHGNHDAWPVDLPLLAPARIAHQRARLQGTHAVRTVQCALKAPLGAKGEVQIFSIDTVDDAAWANTWARGEVGGAQLMALDAEIQRHAVRSGKVLRILLTHHPVHYPAPRPLYQMVIADDAAVGASLAAPAQRVHVVLSGHTHALYPPHGALPASAQAAQHDPLGAEQVQLVSGTLMQLDRLNKRGDHPHQCEVLRVYFDEASGTAVIERRLAARNPIQGRFDFDFVPLPGHPTGVEEIAFAL